MMTDCWMDPYGNVYYVEPFKHSDFAEKELLRGLPEGSDWRDIPDLDRSYDDTLQKRGWVRFTTTIDRWSCEHTIDYEKMFPRPTRAQIDKMWELTGFNYDDPDNYSYNGTVNYNVLKGTS